MKTDKLKDRLRGEIETETDELLKKLDIGSYDSLRKYRSILSACRRCGFKDEFLCEHRVAPDERVRGMSEVIRVPDVVNWVLNDLMRSHFLEEGDPNRAEQYGGDSAEAVNGNVDSKLVFDFNECGNAMKDFVFTSSVGYGLELRKREEKMGTVKIPTGRDGSDWRYESRFFRIREHVGAKFGREREMEMAKGASGAEDGLESIVDELVRADKPKGKWLKAYEKLIEMRRRHPIAKTEGTFEHHVEMKCLSPSLANDKDNIVVMTGPQHSQGHFFQWRYYKEETNDKKAEAAACRALWTSLITNGNGRGNGKKWENDINYAFILPYVEELGEDYSQFMREGLINPMKDKEKACKSWKDPEKKRKRLEKSKMTREKNRKNKAEAETPAVETKRPRTKEVIQCTPDGKFVRGFPSISEASRETKVCAVSISLCCGGKRMTAGGYAWHFKKDAVLGSAAQAA